MKHLFSGMLFLFLTACSSVPATIQPTPSLIPRTPTAPPPETATVPASTATVSAPSPTPSIPDAQPYDWKVAAEGLRQPVDIQNAGDGSGRLFLVERRGRIHILQDGALLAPPFLDISARVLTGGSEQGLLGLAFHPRFAENGYFYVNYIDLKGNTVVARFQASGNRADPESETRLLYVKQPYPNHNGGSLAFGPDGYLYIGLGDGGSGGDPQGNAQSLNTLLGKLLRIDVNAPDLPYAIPADNPFRQGGLPEIWAYGLRNPWRFSFDPLLGHLYIGDVGQGAYEEIDFLASTEPGGVNFGWNSYEGFHQYLRSQPPLSHRLPIFEYDHTQGCSVTGGVIYRGSSLPEWNGVYLFGDFCSGRIWGTVYQSEDGEESWNTTLLFSTRFNISTFGLDEDGEVYLADYASGRIYRLGQK